MRVALTAAVLLLAFTAGCGGTTREAAPETTPPTVRKHVEPAPRTPYRRVYLGIVDGDTGARVRGAIVRVGDRTARMGPRRTVAFRVKPGAVPVTIWAPGYGERTLRLPLKTRRHLTVRLFQPGLQWPMYGVNATRTQAHDGIRLRPPFRVVWSRGIGTLIEFPAVVSDGVAYIGNYRGTVRAIDMRNGKVVWRRDVPRGKMAASPAVTPDAVVVHGMDGYVRVLDRRNGRVAWSFRVGSPVESSPIIRDGVDYFGAWNGRVYALDLRKRRLRWTYGGGYKITSSAAIAGRTLFIGDYAGRLLALNAWTGRRRWSRTVDGRVYGTPAVERGRVFVPSSTGGSLTAFSTSGRYLWRVDTGSYVYSSPAVEAGRVFFGSYNGRLYSVSARTGGILWSVGVGGPVSGAAVVVDGVAYAGSTRGSIIGADARNGRVVLRFPHGEYVPVSGNGGRLLLHGYSRLYAVEPVRSARRVAARGG
jgi:outer membrane protein assembly factor BamB